MEPRRLAVRPQPYTGESLASFAGRLARDNHVSLSELLGEYVPPAKLRYGDPQVIEKVHHLTGVDHVRLAEMAHPQRLGTTGTRKGFLGLRTREQAICSHCHGQDGIRLLEWDHPLIVVCVYCHRPLSAKSDPIAHDVAGRWLLNDLLDARDNFLHMDESPAARRRIELLCRMGRTVARNMTGSWPSSRYPALRQAARRAHQQLQAHPSRRDLQAAPSIDLSLIVIATCWDHTLDARAAERFLAGRIRADRNREEKRLRGIAEGRAEVERWTKAASRHN